MIKEKLKELRASMKKNRVKVLKRKKNRELGKPKKPLNSFFQYKKQNVRNPNEIYQGYMDRIKSSWQNLSDAEREKYKPSQEEILAYHKALLKWEEEMTKLGHHDVVRLTYNLSPSRKL